MTRVFAVGILAPEIVTLVVVTIPYSIGSSHPSSDARCCAASQTWEEHCHPTCPPSPSQLSSSDPC